MVVRGVARFSTSCRPGWLSFPHILKNAHVTSTHWPHQHFELLSFLAHPNNALFNTSGRVIESAQGISIQVFGLATPLVVSNTFLSVIIIFLRGLHFRLLVTWPDPSLCSDAPSPQQKIGKGPPFSREGEICIQASWPLSLFVMRRMPREFLHDPKIDITHNSRRDIGSCPPSCWILALRRLVQWRV